MPRGPRIDIPGFVYHVTDRGVKQSNIFLEDSDRQHFMRWLKITQKEFPFHLLDYCLMTNHYHFLLQTMEKPLSKIMQYLNGIYGGFFNRKYAQKGHLFQGRYHSIPVEEDAYLTVVSRYIHLNPVRAGIVARPEDYPWSNYRATIQGLPDPVADPSFVLGYFGKRWDEQRARYRHFVEDGLDKPEPVTDKVLRRMRNWGNPYRKLNADEVLCPK